MRYTFYLVIFLCFFSIKTIAQQSGKEKISISFQNISLKEAMQEIEKFRNIHFLRCNRIRSKTVGEPYYQQ